MEFLSVVIFILWIVASIAEPLKKMFTDTSIQKKQFNRRTLTPSDYIQDVLRNSQTGSISTNVETIEQQDITYFDDRNVSLNDSYLDSPEIENGELDSNISDEIGEEWESTIEFDDFESDLDTIDSESDLIEQPVRRLMVKQQKKTVFTNESLRSLMLYKEILEKPKVLRSK